MTTRFKAHPCVLRQLLRDTKAVAAVEFALLLPLLFMFLGATFEVGRGWLSYQRFVTVVDNTARWSARFPMFENKVRTGVDSFVTKFASPLLLDKLDLSLRSVKMDAGVPKLEFPAYNFYGNTDNMNWSKALTDENFVFNEAAIVVTGRYAYRPLFSTIANVEIQFTYSIATNPFFSRKYQYEAGNSDWNYWNVQ